MARKSRILIVLEHARIVKLLDRILQPSGRYETCVENDPTQAARAASEFPPDLIIVDLGPQKLSARKTALQIREDQRFANTPIVLVSSPLSEIADEDWGVISEYPWLSLQEKPEVILKVIECYIPKRPEDLNLTPKGISSPERAEPVHLLHGLQGWPPKGPNHFRWKDERLLYSHRDRSLPYDDKDKVTVPTLRQWHDFWRICDEIDIWAWPPWLGDRFVCDGLQWITILEVGGLRVESEGQVCGSPGDFDGKLKLLHHTLQAMTGWKPKESDW